jgi:hypothetical protein
MPRAVPCMVPWCNGETRVRQGWISGPCRREVVVAVVAVAVAVAVVVVAVAVELGSRGRACLTCSIASPTSVFSLRTWRSFLEGQSSKMPRA